jgi:hypothetical protein
MPLVGHGFTGRHQLAEACEVRPAGTTTTGCVEWTDDRWTVAGPDA